MRLRGEDGYARVRPPRAGRSARRHARQRLRTIPTRIWLQFGVVFACSIGASLVVTISLSGLTFLSGLLLGGSAATLLLMGIWLIIEVAGARSFAIGGLAERWTADDLRRLGREWKVVDDVPFNNSFNVDHVAVGPQGVFAVETKFTSVPWLIDAGEPNAALRAAMEATSRRAHKLWFVTYNVGRPRVTPVLVIWGPGAPNLSAGGLQVGDVLVCQGATGKAWRQRLLDAAPAYDANERQAFVDAISEHIRVQEGGLAKGR